MRALPSTFGLALLLTSTARAQDIRKVTEPTFPPTCTVLQAQLAIGDGRPSSETAFDTKRIQDAMRSCKKGQAVELVAANGNNAFLTQPLDIADGVTLLIDGGVTLFASRNPADYQRSGTDQHCGVIGGKDARPNGCSPLFTVNRGNPSKGSGIMGYGVIDGRGGEKVILGGKVMPYSWWDMTHQAYKPGTNQQIANQNNPKIFVSEKASDFTFYKITVQNSPGFNLQWEGPASGWTVWGVKVKTAANVANTDGLEPVKDSHNVTITNSYVSVGDDNIAMDANGPVETGNITITNFHAYAGDGLSINGNLTGGEANILADHVYMYGPEGHSAFSQEGPDFKVNTHSGNVVRNMTFQNFCMQNQHFPFRVTVFSKEGDNPKIPTYENITFRNITVLPNSNGDGDAGMIELRAYDKDHIATINLDNVVIQGKLEAPKGPPQYFTMNAGPGPVAPALLKFSGPGVNILNKITEPNAKPFPCSASDFPSLVGELYLSTSMATNLPSAFVAKGKPFTLNAMLQAVTIELPAPTLPITFYEGTTAVGTATFGGNGTLASLTLNDVVPGKHIYNAQYPADKRYVNSAPLTFGSVTVTVTP